MRKDVVVTEVYRFAELSDEVKQKVIDKWYEDEDYPFLFDNIKEELNYHDKYFSDTLLEYSLSYRQGDGLSFSGNFNLKKHLQDKHGDFKKSVISVLSDYISVRSTGNTGHYSYASLSDIDFYYDESGAGVGHDRLWKLFEPIENEIKEYYIGLCRKLEKYGYEEIEYRMDFNEFDEMSESNGYEYTADGSRY